MRAFSIASNVMRILDARLVSIVAITILLITPIAQLTSTSAGQEDIAIGAYWKYWTEIEISSLNLAGTVTVTYNGQVEKDVEGQDCLLDHYYWEGSLDITGYYSAGVANGTATYRGHEYVSSTTGYEVLSDMNMSLNFTTCYGSLDQKTYNHWHRYAVSFLPPGGTGDEPETRELGTSWNKTFTVHAISRGTFWWGEFIDIEMTETRTHDYLVDGIGPISVPAGDFESTAIRSAYEDDVFAEWRSDEVGRPVKILKEYDDVKVYHSGEDWNMTLESYNEDPSDRAGLTAGAWGLIGAAVIMMVMVALVLGRMKRPRRG